MLSGLNARDNILLQLFLEGDLLWHTQLIAQISNSRIQREDLLSSYFVNFIISAYENIPPIPVNLEVPLEVIIGDIAVPREQICGMVGVHVATKSQTLLIRDNNAFGVRLHFKNGYAFELEVYSISGKRLDIDNIRNKRRVYIIYDEQFFNTISNN